MNKMDKTYLGMVAFLSLIAAVVVFWLYNSAINSTKCSKYPWFEYNAMTGKCINKNNNQQIDP